VAIERTPPRQYVDWAELPLVLDADDLATLLRTSTRAIYAMHQRRQLPQAMGLGQRRLLWERDVVLEWLGKRRAPSRGDP
jgi:predicted DNA-binding transcriptional regulator AlpA